MFVIHKSSRMPTDKSYSGPTWDAGFMRDLYKEQYADFDAAKNICELLSLNNPVGFSITNLETNEVVFSR